MSFIDETINEIQAGNGGNGIVAFRKEKYVPLGGPDGGNGGNGGSVFFIGSKNENNLNNLKYQKILKAQNGENGKNKNKNGANADDVYIKVPLGTIIYNLKNNQIIGEIVNNKDKILLAKGGIGGRGNKSLSNFKNPVPMYAEKGSLGEKIKIKAELKIIADVGLIGFPNVGKSTLVSLMSKAKPKISDYPFTTINPHLGVVYTNNHKFTIADLPGLIPDAHTGKGMGFKFLKHIERCNILIHICNMERKNPYEDLKNLNKELKLYNKNILNKPQIILANKMDTKEANKKLSLLKKQMLNEQIIPISLLKNPTNIQILKDQIIELLKKRQQTTLNELDNKNDFKIYTLKEKTPVFTIEKDNQNNFIIKGKKVENFFYKTDFDNEESTIKFAMFLKKIGVEDELIKQKAHLYNHKIKICNRIFQFIN